MTRPFVTLPTLGSYGRLGNQLWQIAAAAAHARRNDAECLLHLWEYEHVFPGLKTLGIRTAREIRCSGMWAEPSWNMDGLPPYWPRMGLHGYFQCPAYWDPLTYDEIRLAFTPKLQGGITVPPDLCVVHVRRGDYLHLPDHHVVPDRAWHDAAWERMRERGATSRIICTDDPVWCAREWPDVEVSQRTEAWDLALMAQARYVIVAPSSFSWWGAFLAGGEANVIAPARWFGKALEKHRVQQLDPGLGWEWL